MSNLTVSGDSDYTSTGTPDTFTPVSNGPSGSEGLAEHINGACRAIIELQALLGNALTLKGSVADLVTRLSLVVGADGALAKGTSFPGSPIDGQPFYRTDEDTFYVYDATSTTWKSGTDNPLYVLTDGSRKFTGDVWIKKTIPSVRLTGTEGSAKDYRVSENAGALSTYINTGTEGSPIWTEDNFFCPPGIFMAYGGTVAPNGWLECNGQAVSRTTEARLFAILGTGFGVGDGSTTFNVPDCRDAAVIGAGASRTRDFTISALDAGADELTLTSNVALYSGQAVLYDQSGGSDIGGLTDNTTYFVIRVNATTVKLATTELNAYNGTAINITGAMPGGTHLLKQTLSARTRGDIGGSEDQHITTHAHVKTDPGHEHTQRASVTTGGANTVINATSNPVAPTLASAGVVSTDTTGITYANSGGPGAQGNMMPWLAAGMVIVKT